MRLEPTLPDDKRLLDIVNLYPNNCYIFFHALAGAHHQGGWEKAAELARYIQDWCESQKKLITVGEV